MKRIVEMAEWWSRAISDVQETFNTAARSLVTWSKGMRNGTEPPASEGARVVENHPRSIASPKRHGTAPSSSKLKIDDIESSSADREAISTITSERQVVPTKVRWSDLDNEPIQIVYESRRTQYGHLGGNNRAKNRSKTTMKVGTIKGFESEQAINEARARALKRAERRERQSKEWKTRT